MYSNGGWRLNNSHQWVLRQDTASVRDDMVRHMEITEVKLHIVASLFVYIKLFISVVGVNFCMAFVRSPPLLAILVLVR